MDGITSRLKIRLDTQAEVLKFVNIADSCPSSIVLNIVDNDGMCVNARSVLGVLYAQEFKHMWLESNSDKIHTLFREFSRD